MFLRDFLRKTLLEGGNLEIDGTQAQQIDLKVHNRNYIVPILNNLLNGINHAYTQSQNGPLWSDKVLKSRDFLSGSSLHFFNTDLPDDEFTRVKPKVGDIDTQVNKEAESNLAQFLNSVKGQVVGNAKFLGYSRGNEQFSSLWELTDPPIKVQIDFEFVDYEKDKPTDWSKFSHSSDWSDLSQGIKGVFHKFLIGAFTRLTTKDFLLRKLVGRGKARTEQDVPTRDNMFSFAVSSKEGGGLRPKYEPVLDEKGRPLEINGLAVMRALPTSGYEKDLGKIFQSIFGNRVNSAKLKSLLPNTWSFTGLIDIMNATMDQQDKEQILDAFVNKLYAPGAQGLYKGDPDRDMQEKNAALNYMLARLGVEPPKNLEQMRQEYKSNYKVASEGAIGLDEADQDNAPVKAQLRKGMPHLRDLKAADFLDLLDEIHDGNGRFKLQNIPLNVKVDGFGGRFGKNSAGRPFMGTSRTEPRYEPGFVKYHQQKGTTDPDVLNRAQLFDDLFEEMMKAVQLVDSKLGENFLVGKQVTCEVLFLPFATETPEGKLKFVGIAYDQLPKGVQLALVPFHVTDATTGEGIPDQQQVIKQLTGLGRQGSVMFIDNSLTQQQGLDVTEIINPLENLDELKSIMSDTTGKRDRVSLQLRKEIEEKLMPVKLAFEKAVIEDPNIIGKDILGKDYEGIVINSRLGPIKVTSTEQKNVIAQKQAAKAAARAEHGRENSNKTAVVAIGSFVGHKGHQELWNLTVQKAKQVGGDPYLFIGNAVGKDDPIPPEVKVQTWHKMYPKYARNISSVMSGGSIMQKIKHELINPLPGKPPRYDNIIVMVGEDQAKMPIASALMKAVNKFAGYEHVKVSLEVTPRGTGMSFTRLRNILKDPNATAAQQYALWSQGFDMTKLDKAWITNLMDITRKGMGINNQTSVTATPKVTKQPVPQKPKVETRLFNALVRPIAEISDITKISYKQKAQAQVKELEPWTKKGEYKDIAQRAVQRREKGLARVKDIEVSESTYKIVAGDTLSKLAQKFGTDVATIMQLNPQIKDANKISVGAMLNLPASAPAPQSSIRTGPNANISPDTRQRAADFVKTNNKQPVSPAPAPAPAPVNPAAKTASNKDSTPDQTLAFGDKTGSKQNFDALQDPFQEKVEAAAAEYFAKTGKKLSITSAWRDPKDQERLYQQTIALGTPGIGPKGMAVGKPGTSKHEKGLAVDVQQYTDPIAVAALNKQGLYQTVKNDPVHFTLAENNEVSESTYKIVAGDTLSKLAQKFGTTVDAIMKLNPQIKDANKIFAGATLNLPVGIPAPQSSIGTGPTANISPDTRQRAADFVKTNNNQPVSPAPATTRPQTTPGNEKEIASVLQSGPGFIEVKTVDGEIQRRKGNANWRMNNPGNIRVSPWTKQQPGFIGAGDAGPSGQFAVFASLADGMQAKKNLLFGPNSKYFNLSIRDAITRYAPPSDNNPTDSYINQVVQGTKATPDTPLSKLTTAQQDAMMSVINKVEGFKVGSIETISNVAEAFGPLPQDGQQIQLGRFTVSIERVGMNKNYIGFSWHDSRGQEHYEEVPVGDLGSYDDLKAKIKQEIKYQERKIASQGAAEAYGPWGKKSAAELEKIKKAKEREQKQSAPGQLRKTTSNTEKYKSGQAGEYFSKFAEGNSGARYKVKSIGRDAKGDYYISPNTGKKVYKKAKVGDHETPSGEVKPKVESMLPKSAFASSDKNKLGPAAHLKGKMKRPARQGDLVGSAQESRQIPVSEDVEMIFATLIDKIIVNEAIQNNQR